MKGNYQFSIAMHLMTCLGASPEGISSNMLAHSVNTSPSFIRRTLSKLSKANLVKTTVGKTGTCKLARDAERISLLDIYRAIEAPKAFSLHEYPTMKVCPVSCRIKSSMSKVLEKTQAAMEKSLNGVTLADLVSDVRMK